MTGLDISVLSPVGAVLDRERLPLGGSKPRSILALLALEPDCVVPAACIVEALWGEDEEINERSLNTLQVHISNLRRALQPAAQSAPIIARRPPGYVLDPPPERTDLGRFGQLLRDARQHAAAGSNSRAAEQARAALAEWTGEALAGLEYQQFYDRLALRLRERRREATLVRLELELDLDPAHVPINCGTRVSLGGRRVHRRLGRFPRQRGDGSPRCPCLGGR